MSETLKPCPFCGGEASVKMWCEPDTPFLVMCESCKASVKDYATEAEAIEAWNRRTIPSAEPERKIIYCKDCKFAHLTINGEVKYCDVWFPETKTYLSADDFCSSAEKRGE